MSKVYYIGGAAIAITLITILVKKVSANSSTSSKGVTDDTYEYIKTHEGEKLIAYNDSTGKPTIGIGHLILPNEKHLLKGQITFADSYKLFKQDSEKAAKDIKEHVKVPLSQNQFDALLSLVFNIGVGSFNSSTVLKEINDFLRDGKLDENETEKLKNAWLAWKNAGGKPVLLSRRKKEFEKFIS